MVIITNVQYLQVHTDYDKVA